MTVLTDRAETASSSTEADSIEADLINAGHSNAGHSNAGHCNAGHSNAWHGHAAHGPYPGHFWPLVTVYSLSTCLTFSFTLLGPVLVEVGGLSPTAAALSQGLAFLVSGLAQSRFGHMLDRGQHGVVLGIAAFGIFYGLATLIVSAGGALLMVLGVVGLLSGMGIINTAFNRFTVGDVADEVRAEATAKKQVCVSVSLGVGAVLAYLYMHDYYEWLLAGDLVSTLGVIAVLYAIASRRQRSTGPSSAALTVAHAAHPRAMPWRLLFRVWRQLFAVYVAHCAVFSVTIAMPLIYAELGLDALRATATSLMVGTVFGAFTAVSVVRFINARLSPHGQLLVGGLLLGIGSALIPYLLSTMGIVVATMVWGTGVMVVIPATTVIVYRAFGQETLGLASGVDTALKQWAMVTTPLLATLALVLGPIGYAVIFGLLPLIPGALLFSANRRT